MSEHKTEFDPTDVDSFLSALEGRLRVDALALTGYAAIHAPFQTRAQDDELETLSESLRRAAGQISAVRGSLCNTCRLLEVSESLTVESTGEARPIRAGKDS